MTFLGETKIHIRCRGLIWLLVCPISSILDRCSCNKIYLNEYSILNPTYIQLADRCTIYCLYYIIKTSYCDFETVSKWGRVKTLTRWESESCMICHPMFAITRDAALAENHSEHSSTKYTDPTRWRKISQTCLRRDEGVNTGFTTVNIGYLDAGLTRNAIAFGSIHVQVYIILSRWNNKRWSLFHYTM